MSHWLRGILRPELYHGEGSQGPHFEGWYYKLVDAGEAHRFAIIPGVYLDRDPAESHSFVQVMDGTRGDATYHRYPLDAFSADPRRHDVRIGANRFTLEGVSLDLDSAGQRVRGDIALSEPAPWPRTLISPGAMGPFAWIPRMECYHGVLSMDHGLSGSLTISGEPISFDGGRGYMEKDWGRSFPSRYVWMQSNHFAQPGVSLMASVATVPWLGFSFRGMVIGLLHQGVVRRFATYTGAHIRQLAVEPNRVRLTAENRLLRLEVDARGGRTATLHGPTRSDMAPRVNESLTGEIRVLLLDRAGQPLLEDVGRNAGFEVYGGWA